MSWLESLILGLLQGITEFFPVSSSAHLKLAKFFFEVKESESQVMFDLVCHFGTLLALLWFLRKDIFSIFSDKNKLALFFVALVPLVPCYFLLKPLREYLSQIRFLGFSLMATSLILFLGSKIRIKQTPSPKMDALWIGAMQSAALIPGISRSASTISAARALGWTAQEAVRFSFLLSIPTIIGGNCLELLKISMSSQLSLSFSSCLIGFLSSLGIGMAVVQFAIPLLEKGILKPFAWYCLFLGIFVTMYFI